MTTANGDPCRVPRGAVTDATSVCPALTDTTWLLVSRAPPELAWAISVSRTCAGPAGADSATEAASPEPLVLPATTACSLMGAVAAFELNLDAVPMPTTTLYREVSSFPDVREDLAVIVPEHVSAEELIDAVRGAGRPLLADVEVFDVYRDPGKLGQGNKSLALRLTFRAADRTLTDAEVAERRQAIAAAVERVLGGRIRAS